MNIVKLNLSNIEEACRLFLICFKKEDHYEECSSDEQLERMFYHLYSFLTDYGMTRGIFYNDYLIAFLVFFDYNYIKNSFPRDFDILFGPEKDLIDSRLKDFSKLIYILLYGVDPLYRKRGIGSQLIDFVINNYKDYTLATDVTSKESYRIFERKNFDLSLLDTNYYIGLKAPLV